VVAGGRGPTETAPPPDRRAYDAAVTPAPDHRLLRVLALALALLAITSAIVTLGVSLDLFAKAQDAPDSADLVQRLLAERAHDAQVYGPIVIGSFATLGLFLVVALLGVALRLRAPAGVARDVMLLLFVIGGVLGIGGQLVNLAFHQQATYGYCDCDYRNQAIISQAYALNTAERIEYWLTMGAASIVGIGVAVAGQLLNLGRLWRWLSYLIGGAALLAVVLRYADLEQATGAVLGIALGIALPVWAIILARSPVVVPALER
jgi:hypothetical protein